MCRDLLLLGGRDVYLVVLSEVGLVLRPHQARQPGEGRSAVLGPDGLAVPLLPRSCLLHSLAIGVLLVEVALEGGAGVELLGPPAIRPRAEYLVLLDRALHQGCDVAGGRRWPFGPLQRGLVEVLWEGIITGVRGVLLSLRVDRHPQRERRDVFLLSVLERLREDDSEVLCWVPFRGVD